MRGVRMFLLAIALGATTIVVVMLIMTCIAMFKDVSEARDDLYDRIEQVRRVATSVSQEDGEVSLQNISQGLGRSLTREPTARRPVKGAQRAAAERRTLDGPHRAPLTIANNKRASLL